MSDEFGTVNQRRGERVREIERLRQHYRSHRETLMKLVNEAPSEQLAVEYQRMILLIDESLRKIDDLEVVRPSGAPTRNSVPLAAEVTQHDDLSARTTAADQPLGDSPAYDSSVAPEGDNGSRTLLIVGAAILVLALLGWLIWLSGTRDGRDTAASTDTTPVVEAQPDTVASTAAPEAEIEKAGDGLKAAPGGHDYGVIRKGTRATRQFEIRNMTSAPVNIKLARSTCRCFYYEYSEAIAPNATETVTVTVDGAKAKAGALSESIVVSSKKDPAIQTTIRVKARIE